MTKPLNRFAARKALRAIQKLSQEDPEAAHSQADDVLCAFLLHLGEGAIVEDWIKIRKWYA